MELRPADIAKECDVSVGTVRNWCAEYAEFLSTGANPSEGNRLLNERDLEIFRYIASLRKEGMSKPQITLRLRETTFGHLDTDNSIVKPIEALQSLQDAPDPSGQALAPIVAPDYIIALERRFEALEKSSRAGWWWWAVGLLCGLGLAVVFELAAIVASRGH